MMDRRIIKVVFLDRDGVLLDDSGHYYLYRPEDLRFTPNLTSDLRALREAGFDLIVVSNQSGIGKGVYRKEDADRLNDLMKQKLEEGGVDILDILYCPHHPETGRCFCRKPGSLLFEKTMARWRVDPELSWMIGDQPRDIEAAEKAGIRGIQVITNQGVARAVQQILGNG